MIACGTRERKLADSHCLDAEREEAAELAEQEEAAASAAASVLATLGSGDALAPSALSAAPAQTLSAGVVPSLPTQRSAPDIAALDATVDATVDALVEATVEASEVSSVDIFANPPDSVGRPADASLFEPAEPWLAGAWEDWDEDTAEGNLLIDRCLERVVAEEGPLHIKEATRRWRCFSTRTRRKFSGG